MSEATSAAGFVDTLAKLLAQPCTDPANERGSCLERRRFLACGRCRVVGALIGAHAGRVGDALQAAQQLANAVNGLDDAEHRRGNCDACRAVVSRRAAAVDAALAGLAPEPEQEPA